MSQIMDCCQVSWQEERPRTDTKLSVRHSCGCLEDATTVSFVRTTPTHRLADVLLPTTLAEFVAEKRADGRSWRLIARDLHEDTNGQVDVTAETLRGWFGAEELQPAASP